jgi:hypothetical protein
MNPATIQPPFRIASNERLKRKPVPQSGHTTPMLSSWGLSQSTYDEWHFPALRNAFEYAKAKAGMHLDGVSRAIAAHRRQR